MWLLKLTVLFIFLLQVYSDVLTDVFFENLKGHPLVVQKKLSDVKDFIDGQINNYVSLVTGGVPHIKKKRSLLETFIKKDIGVHMLTDVTPSVTVPVKFPEDVVFFRQNSTWFAAGLESPHVKSKANFLVIYKNEKGNFTEKVRTPVSNGVQLSTFHHDNSTFIAVAEYDSPKDSIHNKSAIYQFDGESFVKIQSLDMHFATDVVFWRIHDEIYMSVAHFTDGTHYEIEVPIYKWLGRHFDWVQGLSGKGTRKVTPFVIDSANFLAVANSKDDDGNTRIYSDIYKYDFHQEKYELYQRIVTKACMDIQVFTLGDNGRKKDTFLVVANSYESHKKTDFEKNYETDSIVYKFVDGYFIPFQSIQGNAIQQWLPVTLNTEEPGFVLFASSSFDRVKSFQYDGWSFKEILLDLPIKGELRYTDFNNSSLVVINKNDKTANVFHLEFSYEKNLHEIYNNMMSWCDQGLQKIEELTKSDLFDVMLGKTQRGDIEEDKIVENQEIEARIDSLTPLLDKINTSPPRKIHTEEIIFNNIAFVGNLNTTRINGRKTDTILENVINITDTFELEEANIESVEIKDTLILQKINNHDINTLIYSSDDLTLDTTTIHGTLTLPEGVTTSRVNSIDPQTLLLQEGDQKFTQPLQIDNVKVDKMVAPMVKTTMENLRVDDLTIGGYINDVDVPTLQKYSLKKSGDQVVTADFSFESLQGHNLEVLGTISGRKLSDLVGTDHGTFSINQTLVFSDIFVNHFKVLRTFDGTDVNDGKLDVLLKNHPEEQEITGDKMFDDVVIYQGILLQGRINSTNLDKMNPVVTINDNVFLEGDKTITGQFEVEGVVNVKDVVTSGGTYSFARLEKEGLLLNATEIQPHLYFIQQLNVEEVFVETINGKSPGSFVVLGSEEPQVIQGTKTFLGDLAITGDTDALNINNVDVEELESKVLKVEGDQIIEGKHHIKHIITNRISSNVTSGKNVTFLTNQNVTIEDYQGGVIKADTITVAGLVNNLRFQEIVNDTVTKDTNFVISGHKHFKNLTIKVLHVETDVPIDKIPEQIDEIRLEGPLNIKNIKIENLHFKNECNGVPYQKFGNQNLDGTVSDNYELDKVIVYGDAFITSDKINNLAITDLVDNTVKIDEPHVFNSVTFESEILSKAPVNLDGSIENFDFDNVVFPQFDSIFDEKTFHNVTISGSVNFNGFVNGVNMSEYCKFTMGKMENKNLTINGNVFFAKGPSVANINGASVKKIKHKAWFGDKNTVVSGSVDFGDVIFRDDIEIQGFVDNISLPLLSETYFSKTKDQHIPATFTFEKKLIFANVSVPEITLNGGHVNGINLDLFVRTALLDDYEQVFENVVFLENCFVENVTGEFKVNGFDLEKDVMRYDKVNMVTGTKTIKNLDVESLKLEKNIKIQGVDVLWWMKNSVLKSTGFNITGKKSFGNVAFTNGFQLGGVLNKLKFDANNIMVKDTPQDITGAKTIISKSLNPVIFKGIKLKGLLNDVDVTEIINNQAYQHQDNIFKTTVNLYNNISTTNLVVKKLYQGINMTELITNVTNLGVLNNLVEQYKKLLDQAYQLKEAIKDQAHFLHHYKIIQTLVGVTNSRKILCPDGVTTIGIVMNDESGTRMDLYSWYDESYQFAINATIRFVGQPKYIDQVLMGRYLYTETDGDGNFIPMSMDKTLPIATNLTIHTTSFVVPETNEPCTLFVYQNSPPRIFCEKDDKIIMRQTLLLKGSKATSITIKSTVYLIIISHSPDGTNPHTDLWRSSASHFYHHQSLFDAHPQSVTTTTYKNVHYLAIASGHVQNAMYSGRVEIRRFQETTLEFVPWQSLELDAPIQVDFAVLPSQELVLYVLTDNPTQPLLVFRYEGIGGFQLKVTGSALPEIAYTNQFVGAAGQHFIVAQSYDEINVIEAVFKGEKVD